MAGEPNINDSSHLHASNSRALQNPCPMSSPSSAHSLHCRFPSRPETLPQAFHLPHSSFDQRSSHLVHPSLQQRLGDEPRENEEDEQQYEEAPQEEEQGLEEGRNRGSSFVQENGSLMSGKLGRCEAHMDDEALPFVVRRHEASRDAPFCASQQAFESHRDSGGEPVADDSIIHEGSQSNSDESLQGESENYSNQHSDGSSSGKDMINHLSLHDDEKGRVSPLRALSHIAHIKRKQDYLQNDVEQMQRVDGKNQFGVGVDVVRESSSKRKRLKHVQFQLEPLAYQKLMNILVEQHQGSFERFITATLDSISMEDHPARRSATIPRKLAFSKWKRTRFDQLKGTETEELALAFRSLAESTPNVEVTSNLMHVPWQELNMLQVQKMLEETKKLLLVNEKVHDCPFADCGRRFSTPGNLKDHLNEHSGEQPYSCTFEDCPLRFRSKQHLCRHLKKHERAHTCTFEGCNKRFAFRERLIVHQKIHSDERPLSCPWEGCGKTFKWANSLHGHMRTHTGEKPFQCTFAGCGRLFGYKVDLTRHRRTHFGQPARANH